MQIFTMQLFSHTSLGCQIRVFLQSIQNNSNIKKKSMEYIRCEWLFITIYNIIIAIFAGKYIDTLTRTRVGTKYIKLLI